MTDETLKNINPAEVEPVADQLTEQDFAVLAALMELAAKAKVKLTELLSSLHELSKEGQADSAKTTKRLKVVLERFEIDFEEFLKLVKAKEVQTVV
ncbi:MAG: hypothetical protein PVJ09_03615 [Candidatus Woesebacteria bacterium]|jgi:hypothetical protein